MWSTASATFPQASRSYLSAPRPFTVAAFEAADYLMDRLKTEAVFWKREIGDAGSSWVEPTAADYADRERWG